MQYLKRNTKFSILAFLVIVLSITISISTLAKTEVYFSLSDNPQKAIIKNINQAEAFINIVKVDFLSTFLTSPKPEVQTININTASQDELLKIFQISEPLAQKIIDFPFMSFPRTRESIILREELGGFKDLQTLTQLPEITYLEWEECKEEGIIITVK